MNGRRFSFGTQGNPLLQALSLLVFGVVLVAAVVMGAVVLAAVVGLAVVAGLVFSIRMWWLRRKLSGRNPFDGGGPQPPGPGAAKGARLIEGEYEVIDADSPAERRRER